MAAAKKAKQAALKRTKPAKPVAQKKAKQAAAKQPKPKRKPKRKPVPQVADDRIEISSVTAPSGKLALFDVGLIGYLPREALEPAMIIADVPANRALPVLGKKLGGTGRFTNCWDHVSVVIQAGARIARSQKLGEAGVDFARLIAIDHEALDHWRHEDSLDGLADFVFWGRDAGHLARALRAPAIKDGHGWVDLPLADAELRADQAGRLKADNRWLLATDFRPHSHHFHALAAARQSPYGAGAIDVAGAHACLFFTSLGDGVFPIFMDTDAQGQPVQIRVQLATPDSLAALRAVNS